ncbi:unnamed protein product [Rotaria sp. Silwood2]|nr:unnamed protein product [Rotaria sp. Silwood2]CAF2982827.1 unnamed protein product [Rotaria sp. Silwood2]CAF3223478.1 unnamed protein product [Rotaria sp. Silwood2]CAF3373112.1 unnamed protein product [Rotaria sp. Silwood2]CAF4136503.1 unnamed protein product [Rotaria sp. Silwood2]
MSINRVEKCTICFMAVDGTNGYLRHIRQVHGNDRQFCTHCPLCDSKFIFTYLKSFIYHIRKHISYSSPDKEVLPSLLPSHDEMNLEIINENEEQKSSHEYEQHDPLVEIKKYYIKMLLKLREGHVLPDADNPTSSNFNDDIEKTLFEISRNEESFISSCQLYFKFVKPKEIQLRNGNKAYYISIRDVLMNLFEKKDFYECIKEEKKYISQFNGQDILYHYRNSEIGQQHHVLTKKDNCILLQLYSDDLGVVNPLMGKNATHKLTTFYFSIDDLPARHSSSVNAVYLLLLYYRKDFEDENNRQVIFRQLNQDLKSLENDGLVLPDDIIPTYFTISTLCADNLAAHELSGFTCAFNSGHCCRYCFTHHKDMKRIYKESQTLIRTAASHDLQVKQIQNVPADKSIYGINEKSVLSNLSSFHPITSLPPDIMHDILEGIMPKLTSCLLHTVVSNRLCSASKICQLINKFTYGTNDRRNHPPVLKEKDIFDKRIPELSTILKCNTDNNATYCFKFIHLGKAMEKYCLFLNLPFMLIGFIDKVPYWFLYTLLRQIWDILYSDYPRRSWLSTLEELIEEFLQLFQNIFPEQFIPKFHFLLHAARNISKYGPLKRQMNLRYEAKHHLLKQIANRLDGEEIPLFVEIKYIIYLEEEWCFIVHCYDTVTFKENLWCYEIKPSAVDLVLNKNEFLTHKAEYCYRINNLYFIRVPYRLTLVE